MPSWRNTLARLRPATILLCLSWALGVALGFGALLRYDTTPGAAALSPTTWPASSDLLRDSRQPSLIVLAHPRCPCTRATIGELAIIMTRCQGRVAARVLFAVPLDAPGDWLESDLWESASAIPGVEVAADRGGREARCFGGETSGHVLLYDEGGSLLYSGGITASRGHSGDNSGRNAVISLIRRRPGDSFATPIFGCPLTDPRAAEDENSSMGAGPCQNRT